MRNKVLFLSCDLSGYYAACLRQLAKPGDLDIHVMHYPGDTNAPFEIKGEYPGTRFYVSTAYDNPGLERLVDSIAPHLIICSGWANRHYLHICRRMKGKARTVLLSDNHWRGTLRQQAATLAGPLILKRYFDACWVSGKPQRVYAQKLGFKDHEICEGCYSCDFDYFSTAGQQMAATRQNGIPKKFLYVGRYIRIKGVEELWKAYEEFCASGNAGWELWCVGKGNLRESQPRLDTLKDFGFVQPHEIAGFIEKAGVFVMPSHDDHWGVAIHEFAAAGFPLICSRGALAATAYLREGYNGTYHEPRNTASLAGAFRRIAALSDTELAYMGKNSTNLAGQMTPVIWSSIIREYLSDSLPVFRYDANKAITRANQ